MAPRRAAYSRPFIENNSVARTIQQYNIEWEDVNQKPGISVPKTTEDNISTKDDSRMTPPRNWDDVEAIQMAIRPTFDDYTWLTGQQPRKNENPSSLWLSYHEQMQDLQEQLNTLLDGGGIEQKYWLPRLKPWTGGLDTDKISERIRQRRSAKDTFNRLSKHEEPACHPTYYVTGVSAYVQSELAVPYQGEPFVGDESVDNAHEARLNQMVANDHEAYKCWLMTRGISFYQDLNYLPFTERSWDEWCDSMAPSVFEYFCRGQQATGGTQKVSRKNGPAVEMIQRPVITFQEAKRGNKAWRDTKGKANDQLSLEASTYLHAFKGCDVFLSGRDIDAQHGGFESLKQIGEEDARAALESREEDRESDWF